LCHQLIQLESYSLEVLRAENGREGIELLEQNPDTDIVLMDIMMPAAGPDLRMPAAGAGRAHSQPERSQS
jgi:CheY-like chemotaxis protein